jgi:ADP-ribosylglycohydrolase
MNFQKEAILDRARGALLGTAVADALGAGYEFKPPLAKDIPVVFKGGVFELGEWTDDTAMMICIAKAITKSDLSKGLDIVAKEFYKWFLSKPRDFGIQTRAILDQLSDRPSAAQMLEVSMEFLAEHERAAGNGSLMRTAVVALPFLSNPLVLGEVADQVSALTHQDLTCREACVIWSKAIRHAILFENFDGIQLAINELPAFRQGFWNDLFDEAEASDDPSQFANNGWVIHAIQAAYKAITMTATNSPDHLVLGIEAAVRVGHDTDTVAAIAGGLLGARWGYSAIPAEWLNIVHGWPGLQAKDLVELADDITEPIWE